MRYLQIISAAFLFSFSTLAQSVTVQGKVTSFSSQYVYVSFESTEGIVSGDTLFSKANNQMLPLLIARYISSTSVSAEKINGDKFEIGTNIFARIKINNEKESETTNKTEPVIPLAVTAPVDDKAGENYIKSVETEISGRYSIQSYSNFTNIDKAYNFQRWRHSLKFAADNIGGTGLSFSTYSIFNYKADEWNLVSENFNNALKVYDLNIRYEFDETFRVSLGRFLNRKISNLSTVDGLNVEKSFSSFTFGAVAGSRPDFKDFGFNSKLFEYGAYINKSDTIENKMMENTAAYFEQTNDFKTDRRFIYLQHSNNIIDRTNLFASAEIDLYKKEYGVSKSDFSLTGLFVSARYAPVRELSFNLSYDARKNVIYYETFKSIGDSIFENETRQGFRFRTVVRPTNYFSIGLNYGYRYKKSDLRPSNDYGGFLNYSSIPIIETSAGINFNRLTTSYIEGYIYSFRLSKTVYDWKSDFSVGFRRTDYTFVQGPSSLKENSVFADFGLSALYPVYLSISYEAIFEDNRTSGRVLIDLTTRF